MDFKPHRTAGREYLCLGVKWSERVPYWDLVEAGTRRIARLPLHERRFGWRGESFRYCIGRYEVVGTDTPHVPCKTEERLDGGSQCGRCAAQDEFRLIHRLHASGGGSVALNRYLAQPHWLYVATFADGTSKVGTAAAPRRDSRVDEQGPVLASYVSLFPDGRSARTLEEACSRQLSVPQAKSAAAKVLALASAVSFEGAGAAHARVVEDVRVFVRDSYEGLSTLEVREQPWTPPTATLAFFECIRDTRPALYPHDLSEGDHGFFVLGCAGQVALATTTGVDDGQRYVLGLAALKGRRIVCGEYTSPQSYVQSSLL